MTMIKKRRKPLAVLPHAVIISLTMILLALSGCGAGDSGITGLTGDGSSSADDLTNAKLQWDAPTTNEDGTPLTDLKGYKVYFGPSSGDYQYSIDVGDETSVPLSTIVDSLDDIPPTLCVVVTAYDTYGNESDYSNEVCKDIIPAG
ncbi:MAG: hypothetical protein GXP63_03320 [DPANN group archaeon]|nr:hypothetical protein [DPANN group archaeon]